MKQLGKYKHEWKFDLPWHMVDLRDWFYMVNVGYIFPTHFLHVRILGIRSLWTYNDTEIPQISDDPTAWIIMEERQ